MSKKKWCGSFKCAYLFLGAFSVTFLLVITIIFPPILNKKQEIDFIPGLDTKLTSLGADSGWLYAHCEDGTVSSGAEATWNLARTTGDSVTNSTSDNDAMRSFYDDRDELYTVERTFLKFDTSSLPDGCTITDVEVGIYGATNSGQNISIQKGTHGDGTLTTADFTAYSGSYYDTIDSWVVDNYNNFTLNAQGMTDINRTGFTYYCLREYTYDYLDSAPADDYKAGCYFSESAGTTKDPRINITYTSGLEINPGDNETPVDDSTLFELSPTCEVYISHGDGDTSTCNFYTSDNGSSWTHQQINTSILNETIRYDYTTAWNETYYWKVTAYDGNLNISETFNFTMNGYFPYCAVYFNGTDYPGESGDADLGTTNFDIPWDTAPFMGVNPLGNIYCGAGIAFEFNESQSQFNDTAEYKIDTMYVHAWQLYDPDSGVGVILHNFSYNVTHASPWDELEKIETSVDDYVSSVVSNMDSDSDTFNLTTPFNWEVDESLAVFDNVSDMYLNFTLVFEESPHIISNCTISSFFIPNIPPDIWDGTDNSTDSDGDGLSDHMELNSTYGYSTNPFRTDTDNDGVDDDDEILGGSDPNDWTETNNAPTVDYKTPVNGTNSIDYSGGVTCYVYTNDTDGDTLDITFATNESGSWVNKYTNASEAANGTESYTFTDFDTADTTYYWKVYVNDGTVNISAIYHFTTNNLPTITNPYPANQSTDVSVSPTLNITIDDADGGSMNITWYSNSSGSWQIFGVGGMNNSSGYSYGFESGEGWYWSDATGSNTSAHAHLGSTSYRLEDYDEYARHNLSLANYSKLNLSYWLYPESIEAGEDFKVRFYNGTGWTEIRDIDCDGDPYEDTWTHFYDELTTDSYVFNDDCKISWEASAGIYGDDFFLDDVDITCGHTGSMPNGTYAISNSNFTNYNTKYYWNVSVNDGVNTNDSDIFHFTTIADTTPPAMTINFVGNLSDLGGPYWLPPDESTQLTGDWSDGYYTNDSRQKEDWIYLNLTVTDSETTVTNVWLQWLNETTWTNWTYAFVNTVGNYWEYNTSGNIQTCEGYNYSFNIMANSSGGSNLTWWNKTGTNDSNEDGQYEYTRRYIQLNCTATNISYTTPFYLYNASEHLYYIRGGGAPGADKNKADHMHHDQGADGTATDTGYTEMTLPNDGVDERHCSAFVGFWFDSSVCAESFTLDNIYYHFWWGSDNEQIDVGWDKTRYYLEASFDNSYSTNESNQRSEIYYNGGQADTSYSLDTHLLDVTNTDFTDNNIYEICIEMTASGQYPTIISNRSFVSFVLLNVPSNESLNITGDSDSDGLDDWTELYVTYTHPFLSDTDNDGINDYWENNAGSDPNNYTESFNTSWQSFSTDINGSYINTTEWTIIITTINGTYTNTTNWTSFSTDINGSYSNTTSWSAFSTNINGSYLNSTSFSAFSTDINGTYTNTSTKVWQVIDSSINGSYTNTTSWNAFSTDINGTYTNTTIFTAFSTDINGSYTNTTIWNLLVDTINGSYINTSVITWQTIDNTINGSYTNTTNWISFSTDINGSYINSTNWQSFSIDINGTYSNTTSWSAFSTNINGTYTNTSTKVWQTVDTSINGSYTNSTVWVSFSTDINGTYTNSTTWSAFSTSINGSYINTTSWSAFSTDINGTYTNTSDITWQVIDNNINGSYTNTTNWTAFSSDINGTYSNTTSWSAFSTSINGSYTNSTSFYAFSTDINGTYSNTSGLVWQTIISIINGSYTNTSIDIWQVVINTINGTYTNTSFFNVFSSDINGSYTNISNNIVISDEFPCNNTYIQSLQPTVYFTLTNPSGRVMNYTIYIGNSSANTTTVLDTGVNVTNGTYYFNNYYTASNYTSYWWRVYVNDSIIDANETFKFTTNRAGGGVISSNSGAIAIAAAGMMIGIIALVFAFSKRRRKINEKE